MSAGARILQPLIRGYQTAVSPLLAPRCRYYPSCSSYALQAVKEYGVFRGLVLSGWRLLRCNPFSHGGVDHVHEQRLFKRAQVGGDRVAGPA